MSQGLTVTKACLIASYYPSSNSMFYFSSITYECTLVFSYLFPLAAIRSKLYENRLAMPAFINELVQKPIIGIIYFCFHCLDMENRTFKLDFTLLKYDWWKFSRRYFFFIKYHVFSWNTAQYFCGVLFWQAA